MLRRKTGLGAASISINKNHINVPSILCSNVFYSRFVLNANTNQYQTLQAKKYSSVNSACVCISMYNNIQHMEKNNIWEVFLLSKFDYCITVYILSSAKFYGYTLNSPK